MQSRRFRNGRTTRHFRFIVSPEQGHEINQKEGGLTGYTRELMERDLKTPLQWVAINHYNTDDLHTHLLVRGRRSDGKELRIDRQYIQQGMAQAAREIATAWVGERTEQQMKRAADKKLTADRYTELDAFIERNATRIEVQIEGEYDCPRPPVLLPRGGCVTESGWRPRPESYIVRAVSRLTTIGAQCVPPFWFPSSHLVHRCGAAEPSQQPDLNLGLRSGQEGGGVPLHLASLPLHRIVVGPSAALFREGRRRCDGATGTTDIRLLV